MGARASPVPTGTFPGTAHRARRPHGEGTPVALRSIQSRLELRKRLACKPFKWYLENVYPELR